MQGKSLTLWQSLGMTVIVIVGIAAMAKILFPVCACASGKARQVSCLSNEKQLMLGVMQYAQDNDQATPNIAAAPESGITWRRLIFPYLHNNAAFQCPSRRNRDNGPDRLPRSYAANYNAGRDNRGNGAFAGPGSKSLHSSDFKNPAALIAICEFAGGNTPEFNIDDPVQFGPSKRLLWAGHWHGSNYGFADGHVKFLRPAQTKDNWHRNSKIPLSANGLAVLAETTRRAGS